MRGVASCHPTNARAENGRTVPQRTLWLSDFGATPSASHRGRPATPDDPRASPDSGAPVVKRDRVGTCARPGRPRTLPHGPGHGARPRRNVMAAQRPLTRRTRAGLGIGAGVLALGIIGSFSDHSPGTTPAADERAAATSTAAPTTHGAQPLRAVVATTPTPSPAVVSAAPPKPLMTMTCPAGGTNSSPVFGQQIAAAAPYTVVIDYGDGDRYENDGQHLGAIFSHTYSAAGSFAVTAVLTDATGQTANAACTYGWTRPTPAPVVRSSSGSPSAGSRGGTSTSSGGSGGDTYTNVDGNEVHSPVKAPAAPAGATAHCKDGTWSFSQHRQGTCSGHGGVASWI